MKHKTKFTKDDLKKIEGMAAVRLPNDMIASIMGISKETFARMVKTDAALRDVIDSGRSNFSGKVRNTLAKMATTPGKDQMAALKFWCQTQEGFKSADRIELTGADGGPVEVAELSNAERKKAIAALSKKLKLTDDE